MRFWAFHPSRESDKVKTKTALSTWSQAPRLQIQFQRKCDPFPSPVSHNVPQINTPTLTHQSSIAFLTSNSKAKTPTTSLGPHAPVLANGLPRAASYDKSTSIQKHASNGQIASERTNNDRNAAVNAPQKSSTVVNGYHPIKSRMGSMAPPVAAGYTNGHVK